MLKAGPNGQLFKYKTQNAKLPLYPTFLYVHDMYV